MKARSKRSHWREYSSIWIEANGPIPLDKNGRSYEIHHINGDHNDNRLENLQLVSIEEHYAIHFNQKDFYACQLIAQRMAINPTMLSNICSELAKERNAKYWSNPDNRVKASLKTRGENNPMFGAVPHNRITDKFEWIHCDGTEFLGTPFELRKTFDLSQASVSRVLSGTRPTVKGWSLMEKRNATK